MRQLCSTVRSFLYTMIHKHVLVAHPLTLCRNGIQLYLNLCGSIYSFLYTMMLLSLLSSLSSMATMPLCNTSRDTTQHLSTWRIYLPFVVMPHWWNFTDLFAPNRRWRILEMTGFVLSLSNIWFNYVFHCEKSGEKWHWTKMIERRQKAIFHNFRRLKPFLERVTEIWNREIVIQIFFLSLSPCIPQDSPGTIDGIPFKEILRVHKLKILIRGNPIGYIRNRDQPRGEVFMRSISI